MRTSPSPYTEVQKWLHFISALIILWATISGFGLLFFTLEQDLKAGIQHFNVSITTLLIPLFLIRTVIAYFAPKPNDHRFNNKEQTIAKFAHKIMYLVVWIVLISGVLMMDRDIRVFNLVTFPPLLNNPQSIAFFLSLHRISCVVLAGSILIHLAAVIKHSRSGRPVLYKMRPHLHFITKITIPYLGLFAKFMKNN